MNRLEMINTLRYSRTLEAAGISREQADAHIQILTELVEGDVATKQDLKELKHEMAQMEHRLIIRLSTIMATMFSLSIAILTFVIKVL